MLPSWYPILCKWCIFAMFIKLIIDSANGATGYRSKHVKTNTRYFLDFLSYVVMALVVGFIWRT